MACKVLKSIQKNHMNGGKRKFAANVNGCVGMQKAAVHLACCRISEDFSGAEVRILAFGWFEPSGQHAVDCVPRKL